MSKKEVVIIGNGISGVTAARHIRKISDCKITIISAEHKYFFSRTALMYVYMGHMKFEHTEPYEPYFWEKNRIDLVQAKVDSIKFEHQFLLLDNGSQIQYTDLILAVGSKFNKFGWPGQELKGVTGLYHKQDLEEMIACTKKAKTGVVIGGGLIGVEMAEMLHSKGIDVKFLVREPVYWNKVLPESDARIIEKHIRKHGVDLRLSTELEEILGDEKGRVKAVKTTDGEIIPCEYVGLAAGVHPNIQFLKSSKLELDKGIMVDEFLQTNIENVYAVGDCAQHKVPHEGRPPIEQVWYTGRMMGEVVAQTITGNKTQYKPGVWFNSAKFFDIEYQTYGWVNPNPSSAIETFYWEHSAGEKAVHFQFERDSGILKGLNSYGIRIRHEVLDRWISERKTMDSLLPEFRDANFDPEFYKKHEQSILNAYNKKFNKDLKLKQFSWKRLLQIKK